MIKYILTNICRYNSAFFHKINKLYIPTFYITFIISKLGTLKHVDVIYKF